MNSSFRLHAHCCLWRQLWRYWNNFQSFEAMKAHQPCDVGLRECLWIIRFGIKFMICTHIIRRGTRCGVSIKIKCLSPKCTEFVHVDALMKKYFNIIGTLIRSIVGWVEKSSHHFVDDSEFIDLVTQWWREMRSFQISHWWILLEFYF